jgi:hypothetical protein
VPSVGPAAPYYGVPPPDYGVPPASGMSRSLLKLAERSLLSMLLRDFQLFVKSPVMQLV